MRPLRIFLIVLLFVLLPSFSFGAILNLKATWTPNTDPGVAGYNLYRIDGDRVKINSTLIPFYPGPGSSSYLFSTTVPDNSVGTLSFVLRAVNISLIESPDSLPGLLSYSTLPTSAPTNLKITKP